MRLIAAVAVALQVTSAFVAARGIVQERCLTFSTGRLASGARFEQSLSSDLVLRISPRAAGDFPGWAITVSSRSDPRQRDLIAAVSPPLVTALAHLQFGPGYGLSASESVFKRQLRFSTNLADDDAARRALEADRYFEVAKSLRLGRLSMAVTNFETRKASMNLGGNGGEVLDWIVVDGEACVPE